MTVWIDDSLLFATSDEMMDHMKNTLHSEWQITDLGEPTKIIGIEINHTPNSINISQQKYIENLLEKEGMANANPIAVPMDPNLKLSPNHSNSYVKLLGSLQFVANSMRLDISYAVNKLAIYTANPGLQHHSTLKWVLRYLVGTKTLGVAY